MNTEANRDTTSRVMDAKSFLRAINNGAQSKVHFFESKIKQMGEKVGKNYRLTSLDADHLMFEDRNTGEYFWADVKRTGGSVARIEITNVKPIKIIEEKKSVDFDKNVTTLVESLAAGNMNEADRAFNLIERQRFRSTVIPESGVVVTRDGVIRKVKLETEIVTEDQVEAIAESFTRAVSEKVEITEGKVVRGTFVESDQSFVIPVNEMTRRRIVARTMKEAAENAWKSPIFCKIVGNIGGLVSEGRLKDAVSAIRDFFGKEQEFCTLTESEIRTLVENALAVNGEFNGYLAKDVARVIFRANLAINKDSIIEAWSKTAQKAQESTIFESAQALAVTETFEEDYQKFLNNVFSEASDLLTNRARAYLVSMKMIQSVLSRTDGEEAQAEAMQQMISALESGSPDTNTVMQAEALLARVSDSIIDSIRNVETFDQVETGQVNVNEPGSEQQDLGGLSNLPGGEADELGGLGGMPEFGAEPAMAGAPPELGAPAPAGAPVMPESTQKGAFTPVEQMKTGELRDELDAWKTHGHIFLAEDGFAEVNDQFNRYIKRCILLGEDTLTAEFEELHDSLTRTDDVPLTETDPYAEHEIATEVEIDSDYKGFVESVGLDSPEGTGIAHRKPKKVSGDDASGAHSAGKGSAAKGGTRMDQPGKGLAKKSVGTDGMPAQPEMKGGKSHKTLKGGLAEGVGMDSPHGNGLVMGKPKMTSGDKADNKAAGAGSAASGKPSMGKLGGKGVVKHGVHDSDGEDASGFAAEAGESEKAGSPEDGVQDKVGKKHSQDGKGLAETQYKWGTKRKARGPEGGRKKAKLASEDVTVTVSGRDKDGRHINWSVSDPDGQVDPMIEIIAAELDKDLSTGEMGDMGAAMKHAKDDMGGEPPMGGEEMGGMETPEEEGLVVSKVDDLETQGGEGEEPTPPEGEEESTPPEKADAGGQGAEEKLDKALETEGGEELGEEGGSDLPAFMKKDEDEDEDEEEEEEEEEGDEEEEDEGDEEEEDDSDLPEFMKKDEDEDEDEEEEIDESDDSMGEAGGSDMPPFGEEEEGEEEEGDEEEEDEDEGEEEDEDEDEEEGDEEEEEGDEEKDEDEEEGDDDEGMPDFLKKKK